MSRWRLLLAPWWVIELATGAKAFSDNPLIGSRRLNARGLHVARVKLAHRMADARRRKLAHLISTEDAQAFARNGFVCVPDFVPPDEFASLRDELMARPAPAREHWQGDAITRRIAVDPPALKALPGLRRLLRDKRWQGLIRYVGSYDVEPLVYIQTILSHRREAAPDPQLSLHADTFHPTVKAWLFLTDVAAEDGPLTYVPGSHRPTLERLAWEQTRAVTPAHELDRLSARGSLRVRADELPGLGLPPPVAFTVKANTLVVADTNGFHARGASTRPSTRIEIWAYGRRNPFLPFTGLDLTGLPGIAERRIPWFWAAGDRLQRWLGQPWQAVGLKRPGDE